MALRVLDRVPVDRIQEQARPVDLGRLLMVLIVGFFYLLGFVTRKLTLGVGTLVGWAVAAVMTGWQDAGKPVEERARGRLA